LVKCNFEVGLVRTIIQPRELFSGLIPWHRFGALDSVEMDLWAEMPRHCNKFLVGRSLADRVELRG
jgi:hypothetical protein